MSGDTVVQPDTGEVTVLMDAAEAEEKTLKAQSYMGMVCVLVKELHDKQAWKALGYPSWVAYCKDRFNVGKSRSYQLIGYAETIALGTKATGLPESTIVDSLPEADARRIDRTELAELLEQAYADLSADTPITTRRELFAAVIDRVLADKNTNTEAGGDDGSTPAGDADPNEGGDGASGHDAGQDDPEPPAAVSDEEPPPSSDEPQQDPAPAAAQDPGKAGAPESRAAATGSTAASSAGAGDGGGTGDVLPTPPAETLPADWRDRIACSVHLLGCPVDLLRVALTDDDRIDLTDLRDHLDAVLAEPQEQTP